MGCSDFVITNPNDFHCNLTLLHLDKGLEVSHAICEPRREFAI